MVNHIWSLGRRWCTGAAGARESAGGKGGREGGNTQLAGLHRKGNTCDSGAPTALQWLAWRGRRHLLAGVLVQSALTYLRETLKQVYSCLFASVWDAESFLVLHKKKNKKLNGGGDT